MENITADVVASYYEWAQQHPGHRELTQLEIYCQAYNRGRDSVTRNEETHSSTEIRLFQGDSRDSYEP